MRPSGKWSHCMTKEPQHPRVFHQGLRSPSCALGFYPPGAHKGSNSRWSAIIILCHCKINHVRSCLSRAAWMGASPWTRALAGSRTAWEFQGSSSWKKMFFLSVCGMFVLLLENLLWSGWEKTNGHFVVVVWYLFKGIQVGPRQFSRREQSVRSEAPCGRRWGLNDISLDFPIEFLISLIQNNFTPLSHK